MHKTLHFIAGHPLTRDNPLPAFARLVRWQVESRFRPAVAVPWIDGARLVVSRGMRGATGNIYCGLHEFPDMGFVLHALRPGDLFVDAGANVGSYTVLAAAVCGADSLAVEPDPTTAGFLRRNVAANRLEGRVAVAECALGEAAGTILFTAGRDTTNRVARPGDAAVQTVRVERLDDLVQGRPAVVMKLDVEGHEEAVLRGAARTLANPSLIAVESESAGGAIDAVLAAAGFRRMSYDPFGRSLAETPRFHAANALFVRDAAACLARVRTAPRRRVAGKEI